MTTTTAPAAFRAMFAAQVFDAVPNADAAELVRMAQEVEALPVAVTPLVITQAMVDAEIARIDGKAAARTIRAIRSASGDKWVDLR
jgi:hypothetical protein